MKVGAYQPLEQLIIKLKDIGITLIDIEKAINMPRETIINIRRLRNLKRQEELYQQIKDAFKEHLRKVEQLEVPISIEDNMEYIKEQILFYRKENERLVKQNEALMKENTRLLDKLLDKM